MNLAATSDIELQAACSSDDSLIYSRDFMFSAISLFELFMGSIWTVI